MNNIADSAKDSIKEGVENPKKTLEKAGTDWVEYIKEHPIQSLLFGIVGCLALKGLMK